MIGQCMMAEIAKERPIVVATSGTYSEGRVQGNCLDTFTATGFTFFRSFLTSLLTKLKLY